MALGIYKPGQGYWVRVLTAVALGLLVLATAAWIWKETTAIELPADAWNLTFTDATGSLTTGQTVTVLQRSDDPDAAPIELGTMSVKSFLASEFNPQATLEKPSLREGSAPGDIDLVVSEGFSASIEQGGFRAIPVVDPLYVQGGLAGIVLFVGAVLVFWFVASKPASCEFLIATDGEMKKVNWSTRREVLGSTWVVIAASFIIAAALYVVDLAFQWFFVSIDVLRR